MPARRDTQIEAPRFRRLTPLQTVKNQSRAWGIRFHSCTWREGLAPSWLLSCKVNNYLAIYPEVTASFRSTGRTIVSQLSIASWIHTFSSRRLSEAANHI